MKALRVTQNARLGRPDAMLRRLSGLWRHWRRGREVIPRQFAINSESEAAEIPVVSISARSRRPRLECESGRTQSSPCRPAAGLSRRSHSALLGLQTVQYRRQGGAREDSCVAKASAIYSTPNRPKAE